MSEADPPPAFSYTVPPGSPFLSYPHIHPCSLSTNPSSGTFILLMHFQNYSWDIIGHECLCAKSLQWCWTLWTSCTAGFSIHGFTRQEYWCELLFPSPRDLPNPGIEPMPPMSPALAGVFFTTSTTLETHNWPTHHCTNFFFPSQFPLLNGHFSQTRNIK